MRIIPEAWLPGADVRRLVIHWTAGGYVVSATDREHYHAVIGRETARGALEAVRGDHPPSDNDYTGDKDYAAHVRGLNTNSFGLAMACMAGAVEGKSHGKYPVTESLWRALALAAADVCEAYNLPVDREHVLFHSEVQAVYHKPQAGKWDVDELSYDRKLPPAEVHEQFRRLVKEALETDGAPVKVQVNGVTLGAAGYLEGSTSWVPLRRVCDALSEAWQLRWKIGDIGRGTDGKLYVELVSSALTHRLPLENREGTGYVPAAGLRPTGCKVTWNSRDRAVSLEG